MNEFGKETELKLNNDPKLDDMEVLFPNQEIYETEDKEMLIAILQGKDNLIKKLWFALKGAREQEQLLRNYVMELESKK